MKQGIASAQIHTLEDDWQHLPTTQQGLLYKIAKGYYSQHTTDNVESFNQKVETSINDSRYEIKESTRLAGLTWRRLPEKHELVKYKDDIQRSRTNFLNRTRGGIGANDDGASSICNLTTDDEGHAGLDDPTAQTYWEETAAELYDEQAYDDDYLPEVNPFDGTGGLTREELMNRDFPTLHIPHDHLDTTPVITRVRSDSSTPPAAGNSTREIIDMGMSRHQAASTPYTRDHRIDLTDEASSVSGHTTSQYPIGTPRRSITKSTLNPPIPRPKPTTDKAVSFSRDVLNRAPQAHSPTRSALRKTNNRTTTEQGQVQSGTGSENSNERVRQIQDGNRQKSPVRQDSPARQGSSSRQRSESPRRPASLERPKWEFGAKQVNYTPFDHRDQAQAPGDFFDNFLEEVNTNLKRGGVWDVPLSHVLQMVKSTIQHKEKKRGFDREVKKKIPRNLKELKEIFADSMTISNQLRKTRFNKISSKPPNETWVDFAQKFAEMFEVAYGMDSEGGTNQVLMERFQRCLRSPREIDTLQQYLLMVDEKFQNIHSLAEKLEIIEYLTISKTEEKHPVYLLKARSQQSCNFCQKMGHSENECRQKKALSQKNRNASTNGRQQNQMSRQNNQQQNSQQRNHTQNNQNQMKCNRCGRNNHTTNNCFANISKQKSANQNRQGNQFQNNNQNNWSDRNRQVQMQAQNSSQSNAQRFNNNRNHNDTRRPNAYNNQTNGNSSNQNNRNNWNNNSQNNNWKQNQNNNQNWQNNNNGNTNYKFNKFRRQ